MIDILPEEKSPSESVFLKIATLFKTCYLLEQSTRGPQFSILWLQNGFKVGTICLAHMQRGRWNNTL
jgi:hypothetical protein